MGIIWDNGKEHGNYYLGFRVYSPTYVDRTWLWVYQNKIPIYPIAMWRLAGSEHMYRDLQMHILDKHVCAYSCLHVYVYVFA